MSFSEIGACDADACSSGLAVALSTWEGDRLKVLYPASGTELSSLDVGDLRTTSWKVLSVWVTSTGELQTYWDGRLRDARTLSSWSPGSDWVMGFGGRTGGSNDRHVIGTVQVDTNVYYKDWIGDAQG